MSHPFFFSPTRRGARGQRPRGTFKRSPAPALGPGFCPLAPHTLARRRRVPTRRVRTGTEACRGDGCAGRRATKKKKKTRPAGARGRGSHSSSRAPSLFFLFHRLAHTHRQAGRRLGLVALERDTAGGKTFSTTKQQSGGGAEKAGRRSPPSPHAAGGKCGVPLCVCVSGGGAAGARDAGHLPSLNTWLPSSCSCEARGRRAHKPRPRGGGHALLVRDTPPPLSRVGRGPRARARLATCRATLTLKN